MAMETERLMEVYRYADRKARFLYNEGFRVQWNGRLTSQLRAIINKYCKADGFSGVEVQMISLHIARTMHSLENNLYH